MSKYILKWLLKYSLGLYLLDIILSTVVCLVSVGFPGSYVLMTLNQVNKCAAPWQNQQNECLSDESLCCPHEKHWVLSYPLSAQRRLWSDWADAHCSLIWVFAGRTLILLVLSCRGSGMLKKFTLAVIYTITLRVTRAWYKISSICKCK